MQYYVSDFKYGSENNYAVLYLSVLRYWWFMAIKNLCQA